MNVSDIMTLRIHMVLAGLLALAAGVGPAWSAVDRAALRLAIDDLAATFPDAYTNAPAYRQRLEAAGDEAQLAALQREALLANPLVRGQAILFVVRHQYRSDHHNTETMFQTDEINTRSYQGGGALKVLDLARGGEVRTLVDPGPEGVVRDPEVSFDGRRVLFSMRRNIQDNYHLYEVNADPSTPLGAGGSGLRQLTKAPGVFDIDPLYLPDDRIVFTSSREPKYCMCNRHIMGNLFRMEADGANIHQIGKSTLHEGHSSLLPDGRILYDRWEYVDRNFGDAQALWTVHPDGTQHEIYWGGNLASPGAVIDGRAVPGSPLVIAAWVACHDRPWGALALLDRRKGMNTRASVVRTWPEDAVKLLREEGSGLFDSTSGMAVKYEDPFPLGDPSTGLGAGRYFLVSRMVAPRSERMGLFLIDVFGNEVLVHDEAPAVFDPMLLAARPRPPAMPSRRDFADGPGTFYLQDACVGTHMAGVERGSVKWLRVVESPEKRSWSGAAWGGQGAQAPAMNWHNFESKRILGTVPVEADGSAYFEVPADRYVFFQLLDADGMMVQSMRSGTIIQSGERQSCLGCHESRNGEAPATRSAALALKRAPSKLDGWHGPPRDFSFAVEVQPVLDRHCVSCHDYGKKDGEKLNLAGDRDFVFSAAYEELWAKKMITCAGGGPAVVLPAKSWGSHASRLIQVLRKGHEEVKLSAEEMDRLITWVDLNAPYFPSYLCAFPDHIGGRCPLDPGQVRRLAELTGVNLGSLDNHGALRQPWISFDRPEVSPILARIAKDNAPAREEALALIRAGAQRLRDTPEADRPGFVPCTVDRARDEKYRRDAARETANRQAIRDGRKHYDEAP